MRRPKSHSRDNQRIRSGVFYFFCLFLFLEGARQVQRSGTERQPTGLVKVDSTLQAAIDSIKRTKDSALKGLRPFNPNMLNDYRGYRLGLSPAVLDSVYAFKRAGGMISTMGEFAGITGLTPEECRELQAYFRFPKTAASQKTRSPVQRKVMDLNRVTAFELQEISGIGPVLSQRILKFRKSLGGFLHESQLLDVYGLDPKVAKRAIDRFKVLSPPDIEPIDINTASAEELSGLLYLSPRMAADLVAYRIRSGPIKSAKELAAIESIPKDRIDRIALYLQFR